MTAPRKPSGPEEGSTASVGGWYSCDPHGVIQGFSADGKCPACAKCHARVTLECVVEDMLDRYDA